MPGFKRTRYLACFYCGRKTSTPYDGRVRQFECPSCDATNYLDEVRRFPEGALGIYYPARNRR